MSQKPNSIRQSPPVRIPNPHPTFCQISQTAEQALVACASMRDAVQQLRDRLINCHHCSAVDKCDLHEHFNLLVDQSIAEINEEWGW